LWERHLAAIRSWLEATPTASTPLEIGRMFLGTIIYGLLNSAVLAVMAIGFYLTFGISGVANFAYGACTSLQPT
jgi:hypothetical protein